MQSTLLKQSSSSAVSGRSAVKCAAIKKDGVVSKTIMGAFAASILASSLCIQTPSMAGEILPEKKVKKAFVREDKESGAVATEDLAPIPLKTGGVDPYAPIGHKPEPNIPNFKGSYNDEPIPGRSYPPPPGPRKEPDMDMDSGKPPVSFTLNKQLGYTIPIPSDEKWVIEYKPPEPKYKFRFPGITPEYDPNIYWDSREEFPENYRAEPTYPYLFAFPQIVAIIAVTYLVASKVDPGWNDFFKKTVVKDVFEEGLGTEDVLKAEVPIILPYEREAMERDEKNKN